MSHTLRIPLVRITQLFVQTEPWSRRWEALPILNVLPLSMGLVVTWWRVTKYEKRSVWVKKRNVAGTKLLVFEKWPGHIAETVFSIKFTTIQTTQPMSWYQEHYCLSRRHCINKKLFVFFLTLIHPPMMRKSPNVNFKKLFVFFFSQSSTLPWWGSHKMWISRNYLFFHSHPIPPPSHDPWHEHSNHLPPRFTHSATIYLKVGAGWKFIKSGFKHFFLFLPYLTFTLNEITPVPVSECLGK